VEHGALELAAPVVRREREPVEQEVDEIAAARWVQPCAKKPPTPCSISWPTWRIQRNVYPPGALSVS
jgi:hypothetical protein